MHDGACESTGKQKPEVRSQKPEARSQKKEARSKKTEMQESGVRMKFPSSGEEGWPKAGVVKKTLAPGLWLPASGFLLLSSGFCISDS
jgi:hypothetical protein